MNWLLLTIRVVMVLCDIFVRHRASSLLLIDLVGREAVILPLELVVQQCLGYENTRLNWAKLLTASCELFVDGLLADFCADMTK